MSDCDHHDEPEYTLSIDGLPWPLKPAEAPLPEGGDCCGVDLVDVQMSFEEPPPAEAVRQDLSCDYSPLKIDDQPESLDWDRVDHLPLDRRPG
jgi:hypothetical protein